MHLMYEDDEKSWRNAPWLLVWVISAMWLPKWRLTSFPPCSQLARTEPLRMKPATSSLVSSSCLSFTRDGEMWHGIQAPATTAVSINFIICRPQIHRHNIPLTVLLFGFYCGAVMPECAVNCIMCGTGRKSNSWKQAENEIISYKTWASLSSPSRHLKKKTYWWFW